MNTKTTIARHPNQRGPELRVRVANGPFVDPTTLETLNKYRVFGVSYGLAIDRLLRFAIQEGFDPVKNETKKRKSR